LIKIFAQRAHKEEADNGDITPAKKKCKFVQVCLIHPLKVFFCVLNVVFPSLDLGRFFPSNYRIPKRNQKLELITEKISLLT
jgi:hypothetical protein